MDWTSYEEYQAEGNGIDLNTFEEHLDHDCDEPGSNCTDKERENQYLEGLAHEFFVSARCEDENYIVLCSNWLNTTMKSEQT